MTTFSGVRGYITSVPRVTFQTRVSLALPMIEEDLADSAEAENGRVFCFLPLPRGVHLDLCAHVHAPLNMAQDALFFLETKRKEEFITDFCDRYGHSAVHCESKPKLTRSQTRHVRCWIHRDNQGDRCCTIEQGLQLQRTCFCLLELD